jgi:hypothetical protein
MCQNIYLDESGDLGWSFDKGSSKFLTIAAISVPFIHDAFLTRFIHSLYNELNLNTENEAKWSTMEIHHRVYFAKNIVKFIAKHSVVRVFSITVLKTMVLDYIRTDINKLYNYMVRLMLSKEMSSHSKVKFYPDQRSMKKTSRDSMHDYIQSYLWFDKKSSCILETNHSNSKHYKGVQIADMIAGMVRYRFEKEDLDAFDYIKKHIMIKKLYF